MVRLNKLVSILLIFNIILGIRITTILTLISISYTIVINKIIFKLKKILARYKVNNILNI